MTELKKLEDVLRHSLPQPTKETSRERQRLALVSDGTQLPQRGEPGSQGDWFGIVPAAAAFDRRLKNADKVCLQAIASFASEHRIFRMAQTRLAARLGWTRQTVGRAIRNLIRAEYLVKIGQTTKPGGGNGANVYRIVGYERRLTPESDG